MWSLYFCSMRIFSALVILFVLSSCQNNKGIVEHEAVGYAQGSTYQIKYVAPAGKKFPTAFDSIFRALDRSMSTYQENSLISRINSGSGRTEVDPLFAEVLARSLEIARETEGRFDPTVGPLVRAWGFSKEELRNIDTTSIDSLRQVVGYTRISFDKPFVEIPPGFKIDFNAIAQGYTVDVIADFLAAKGIDRYMVEVGGELKAHGTNINDQVWRIGVDKPAEEINPEDRFQIILALENQALATSGNYRKFWVDEETGVRYAHTIDPLSGYPAKNRLLSVSVIAGSCMDADAYATACMVMGHEQAMRFLSNKEGVDAYLIVSGEDGEWETYQTPGFGKYIVK